MSDVLRLATAPDPDALEASSTALRNKQTANARTFRWLVTRDWLVLVHDPTDSRPPCSRWRDFAHPAGASSRPVLPLQLFTRRIRGLSMDVGARSHTRSALFAPSSPMARNQRANLALSRSTHVALKHMTWQPRSLLHAPDVWKLRRMRGASVKQRRGSTTRPSRVRRRPLLFGRSWRVKQLPLVGGSHWRRGQRSSPCPPPPLPRWPRWKHASLTAENLMLSAEAPV